MNTYPPFDLQQVRSNLLHRKHSLQDRVEHIREDALHRHEGVSADWAEQAVERENDEVLNALGDASDQELAEVLKALQRIESDQYFYCENCGERIPVQRLQAMPYTSLCVGCAENSEKHP